MSYEIKFISSRNAAVCHHYRYLRLYYKSGDFYLQINFRARNVDNIIDIFPLAAPVYDVWYSCRMFIASDQRHM